MTRGETRLRADAQRNVEKVACAAAEVFLEHGLDAPLEEIARRAGVSVGTIYNRFGSREGLLDSVVVRFADERLDDNIAGVRGETAWARFASYLWAVGETQAADPRFNDVVSRRYPAAAALRAVCDRAVEFGMTLATAAQEEGTLRRDFTAEDLDHLVALNADAVRAGGDWWRRAMTYLLDGLQVVDRS